MNNWGMGKMTHEQKNLSVKKQHNLEKDVKLQEASGVSGKINTHAEKGDKNEDYTSTSQLKWLKREKAEQTGSSSNDRAGDVK